VQLNLLGLVGLNLDFGIFLNQREFIPDVQLQTFLFHVKVVTDAKAQIMVACSVGDDDQVRAILCRDPVSVRYTTTSGVTPLSLAIEHGHLDICRLLLDKGAALNSDFGLYQTSALSWAIKHRRMDIARLLAERNASLLHLNAWGWSPIFYLWPETHRHASSKPFLNLLRSLGEFDFAHQGVVDKEGYSVLTRCAVYGTPEDVLTLIKYGVDPFEREANCNWTVLHRVVYFGVEDMFFALFPMFEQEFGVDIPDAGGRSLLHLAVESSSSAIIRHLLEHGAQWDAETLPSLEDVPESVKGVPFTPLQLAFAYGDKRYLEFLDILDDVRNGTGKDDNEEWFDVADHLNDLDIRTCD